LVSKIPPRPKETLPQLNDQIAAHERQRTTTSMSLKDEKDILRSIYKIQRQKKTLEEYQDYDVVLKQKKVRLFLYAAK
jgi:hypothetical protein